jgi:hypothetical protein
MKSLFRIISLLVLLVVLISTGTACNQTAPGSRETSQQVAEEFVKLEATFRCDGIPDTLKVTGTTAISDGWKFTIQFDCRHAGYGNRTGQVLAEVITPHAAEVTVQAGKVTMGIMDGQWDMINQRIDVEIDLAPIHEVRINLMKSNPPQIGVYIKGGLRDGCTAFNDLQITREGNIVNIKVTTQHPRGVFCPAIYTYFEKNVNLGSDFAFGTTYTVDVNDYTTTFEGTLMKAEGLAIYSTRNR